MRRFGVRFPIAVLIAAMMTACAASDFAAIRPGLEARGHYIEGVPFYRQQEHSCGPAALAVVSSFWGRPRSIEQIAASVYLPRLRGTLPMDMERFMREGGFETKSSAGTLEELRSHVRRNTPVISLLDLGFGPYHQPHYVTVIGFDDVNRAVIVHDGLTANSIITYDAFVRKWARAGYWMLLAVPGRNGGNAQ